jgi:hypothetical protein
MGANGEHGVFADIVLAYLCANAREPLPNRPLSICAPLRWAWKTATAALSEAEQTVKELKRRSIKRPPTLKGQYLFVSSQTVKKKALPGPVVGVGHPGLILAGGGGRRRSKKTI